MHRAWSFAFICALCGCSSRATSYGKDTGGEAGAPPDDTTTGGSGGSATTMGSTDGSGAGTGGDGGATSGSGGTSSSGGTSGSGGTSSTGGTSSNGSGGSAGQAGVVGGVLRFIPAKLVIDRSESSEVSLRFDADDGFEGELEVALSGADGTLVAEPESFVLSADSPARTVQIVADGDAASGRYELEATATPPDGGDTLSASLEVTISGRPGELDVTLGDGAGYFDFQPEGPCSAESVVMLEDGRFVVVGQALTSKLMLARFLEDGSPDTSFGSDGVLILADVDGVRTSPVLLQDGSLLVAFDRGSIDLAKIRDDGSIDDSWGEAGILATNLRAANHVAFAVDDEERILLGGGYYDETLNTYQPVLRRLLPDGALDDSFAGDGTLELQLNMFMGTSSSSDYVEDLALEANGNIVAVGSTWQPSNGVDGYQQYVYRAQSNGQPDSSFGPQGARLVKFGTNEFGNYESAYSVTVQQGSANDRMIVTGGYFRQNADTPYLLSLVRHQVNGELDPAFLGSGKGTHDVPDNTEDFPGRFLRQPDDGILTHIASYQDTNFVVLRFTAAGELDPGFDADGIAPTIPGRAFGIAQSGRRAIVVGSAQPAPDASQKARVARYWVQ